ncbi:NAD(P)H dehydrogenase [Mesorhizobium tianshanense]|uniref:NAD(P)H dehydrogenase (Quinone) n=1 Tax=Mesorhizobium tianshanense TaxID=39844 RepID=A0A562N746_9HYPH|nr:NAD(P)H-dependent oxidoreductase [Mesorhizobium tianshanense]TWI27908.1 NAD(P)H dehydrogenase (quinone) [Mesorhizobium tianshanense]GLS39979.1 NAD(P)H dehydrogenase [Mesorhizobium tianshanense]
MNVLIVYAHPEPTSFNAALVARAKAALRAAGHTVTVSDLYADRFDPEAGRHDFSTIADPDRFHYQSEQVLAARQEAFVPEIAREQARVAAADLLVLQFPLWWGGPPAILKGWFERVLAYGFAYVDGRRFDTGVFKGRRALLSVTTGGTTARFGPHGVYGEIEKVLWQTQRLTLQYMGYSVEEPFVAYGAPRVGDEGRAAYLDEFARRVVEAAAKPVDRRTDEALRESVPADAWAQTR